HIRDKGADKDRRRWQIPGKDFMIGPVFAGTADRLVTTDHKRGQPTPTNPIQWGEARLDVWDAASGKARHEIALPPFVPGCMVVRPDGAKGYLGGSRPEAAILVCDLERGLLAPPLRGHEHTVSALALSPDGRLLASAGLDQSLRLWETSSAKEI